MGTAQPSPPPCRAHRGDPRPYLDRTMQTYSEWIRAQRAPKPAKIPPKVANYISVRLMNYLSKPFDLVPTLGAPCLAPNPVRLPSASPAPDVGYHTPVPAPNRETRRRLRAP